ncbi:dynamin family protein [Lachnospiraceae bacterium 62-35]
MSTENTATSYTSYQSMVTQVSTSLAELRKVCARINLEENLKALEAGQKKLSGHKFAVGVMGEFKRGKSTVINSMLEKEIMPADILPCSATMNRVTYDLEPHVELRMQDGNIKNISVDELSSYVTKLTSENESRAAQVEEAIVYYPCHFCKNGVDIVDTPGLNDDERMNKISEEVIPKLDAVIMVITPDNPFSMSEAEFVRNKLMTSDLSRLIFLVNKMDQIRRAQDKERVVQGIKEKIQGSVLEKMAEMYGESSKEYQDAKQKIGKIRIYPISALDALDGKAEGDQKLIEASGTLEFEKELTKMLTEERGALELGGPLNLIERTSLEIAKTAVTRKNALEMSSAEFSQCQKEALAQISEMRKRKKEEKKRLSSSAVNVRRQMEGQVIQFYPELEKRLYQAVETMSVDVNALGSEAGQKAAAEKMQKKVSAEMETAMSQLSEKIQVQLSGIIGEEAARLGQFTQEFINQVDGLRGSFTVQNEDFDRTNLLGIGVDVLTDYIGINGIGGIVAGYKEAGFKGAAVGGAMGLAANLAVWNVMLALTGIGLPAVIISCAAGSLAGKHLTRMIFKKDVGERELEKIRKSMRESIAKMMADMRSKCELENWVYQLVDGRFDELIAGMESECERLLQDTENTMDSIKRDLTENEMQRKKLEEEYDQVLATVKQVNENLKPVMGKVRQVLESAG